MCLFNVKDGFLGRWAWGALPVVQLLQPSLLPPASPPPASPPPLIARPALLSSPGRRGCGARVQAGAADHGGLQQPVPVRDAGGHQAVPGGCCPELTALSLRAAAAAPPCAAALPPPPAPTVAPFPLHLIPQTGTDYGPFLANEPSPMHTTSLVDACTRKLVADWRYLRENVRRQRGSQGPMWEGRVGGDGFWEGKASAPAAEGGEHVDSSRADCQCMRESPHSSAAFAPAAALIAAGAPASWCCRLASRWGGSWTTAR